MAGCGGMWRDRTFLAEELNVVFSGRGDRLVVLCPARRPPDLRRAADWSLHRSLGPRAARGNRRMQARRQATRNVQTNTRIDAARCPPQKNKLGGRVRAGAGGCGRVRPPPVHPLRGSGVAPSPQRSSASRNPPIRMTADAPTRTILLRCPAASPRRNVPQPVTSTIADSRTGATAVRGAMRYATRTSR